MSIKRWVESIYEHADPNIIKVLVGNKIDKEGRVVSHEDAQGLANKYKMNYFETSAKQNKNIEELMTFIMEEVYQ